MLLNGPQGWTIQNRDSVDCDALDSLQPWRVESGVLARMDNERKVGERMTCKFSWADNIDEHLTHRCTGADAHDGAHQCECDECFCELLRARPQEPGLSKEWLDELITCISPFVFLTPERCTHSA